MLLTYDYRKHGFTFVSSVASLLTHKGPLYDSGMGLGTNIASVRKTLGISQDKLGEAVGVTGASVSQWERNETVPETEKLPLIAKALKTTIGRLFDEEPGLSREDQQFLDILRSIMPGEKGRALDVLRAFMRKSPK